MAITPGWNSQVQATGSSTAMSAEACSVVTGTSNQTWEITASAKDTWGPATTFTVEASEDSGSTYNTLGTGEYTLQYLLGRVKIDNYSSGSGTVGNITNVRVSGAYHPKYTITRCRSASIGLAPNSEDSSVFQDAGIRRKYLQENFTASVESLDLQFAKLDAPTNAEDAIIDYIQNETEFVFELQPSGDSTKVIRAWVKIFDYSGEFSVGSLDTVSLELSGTKKDSAMSSQSVNYWNYKA